jgi:multiple sugar transport system permease protein
MLACALALALQAQEEAVLRVMTHERWFAGYETLEEVAREFEQSHPGVRVEILSSAGGAGSRDKLKFTLAGNLQLDVAWLDVTEFSTFLADGALIDLQPYFDADPAWRPEEYFSEVLEGMRGPDAHLYGLPSTFNPLVMYVNRSLLASEGIDLPPDDWTWQDFERIARAVTRDADHDGRPERYGASITQWLQALAPWIWQNGGRFLNERGEVALDEPAAAEAIAFLQRLLHEDRIASDDATFANQMSVGLFQSGSVAFHGPAGYWETYRFREIQDFSWDYLPLPRGKAGAATVVAMRFYCVPRTSRHPQLAYEFVRALAGPKMQTALAGVGNGVPGLISAARSDVFLQPGNGRREEVFFDVLSHARYLPTSVDWSEIQAQVGAVYDEALLMNRVSAAEASTRAARLANESLARRREAVDRPRLPAGLLSGSLLAAPAALLLAWLLVLRKGRSRSQNREERAAWGFLAPWAIGGALLLAGPILLLAILAFAEWSPVQLLSEARWMGGEQFARLAQDEIFHDSLRVTFWYAALAVPLQVAVALGLALLVAKPGRATGAARTLLYLPTILSPVVLGAVWRWILDDGPWLKDPSWIVPSFVLMSLWTAGAQMLVFIAGLQSLDPALQEAARLDGAGRFRRFLHVTLPALTPVLLFNLVVGLIGAFQVFAQPFVMTQGGPGNESRFLVLYLYDQAFRYLRMGYASTLAWVLFVIVFLLTCLILRSSRRWVHYAGASR